MPGDVLSGDANRLSLTVMRATTKCKGNSVRVRAGAFECGRSVVLLVLLAGGVVLRSRLPCRDIAAIGVLRVLPQNRHVTALLHTQAISPLRCDQAGLHCRELACIDNIAVAVREVGANFILG